MHQYKQDHIGMSVLCALGASALLSVMNVVSKILVEYLDPVEVTFWRNLISLGVLIPIILVMGKRHLFHTKRIKGQFFRAVIGTVGMVLAVWMFALLSLAEGVAISFTAPLFVVILSPFILGEKVGLPRFLAAFIGFCGVLIIAQPWSDMTMNMLGVLVGLSFALMNASVMLCLRWLGDTEHSVTTVFYFLLFGLVGTGLFMPSLATPISHADYWLIAILGIVGLGSLILKTESYRWGSAALVAPLSYSLLLWAIIFDWLIWDKSAGLNVVIGAAIIIGSNAFILWREHHLKKRLSCNEGG